MVYGVLIVLGSRKSDSRKTSKRHTGGVMADRWVRSFLVDETRQTKRGFTLYKITSYLFPRNSPEAITAVTVWKRYSELQKLQRRIKNLQGALYLKGKCPVYAKWSYFRRFDQEVIEERKTTTVQLLEFVALHAALFTSAEFVKFFQCSHPDPNAEVPTSGNIESIRSNLLLPSEAIGPLEYQSSEEDSFSILDASVSTMDSVSMSSSIISKKSANKTQTIDNETDNGLLLNRPMCESNTRDDNVIGLSRDNLSNKDSVIGHNKAVQENDTRSLSQNVIGVQLTEEASGSDLIAAEIPSQKRLSKSKEPTVDDGVASESSQIQKHQEAEEDHAPVRNSSRQGSTSLDTSFNSADLEESYVFEAGYLLSLGARNEAKGKYHRAFEFYNAGIEKMLIGVQSDTNESRKQFVKDKTEKYLSHSERLYSTYLNNNEIEISDRKRSEDISCNNQTSPINTTNEFSKPYNELQKYKVLGIIDGRILLVFSSESQDCYVIKVIQKICNQISDEDYFIRGSIDGKLPVLPINIPHMVNLVAYIETPNALFLVLQHATGGKLFDYIEKHSKMASNSRKSRQVDLNNVLIDLEGPKNNDSKTDDVSKKSEVTLSPEHVHYQNQKQTEDISVDDIVIKSQKLLLDVDDALSGRFVATTVDNGKLCSAVVKVEQVFNSVQTRLDKLVNGEGNHECKTSKSILPPKTICTWGAELLTAIDYLHQYGIVCRTLNPDNLLLGDRGQLMLSYIVGYNSQDSIINLLNMMVLDALSCVYLAPELKRFSLDYLDKCAEKVCDFWSFGVIMYELIVGMPFIDMHPAGINSHMILHFPEDISTEAESLLTKLLAYNPHERLGSGPMGIMDIKSHPYFTHIDWNSLEDSFGSCND